MMSYLERQISKVNGTGLLVRPRSRARFENPNAVDSGALMPMNQEFHTPPSGSDPFDSGGALPPVIPDNQPPDQPASRHIEHGKQGAAQSGAEFTEKQISTSTGERDFLQGNEQHPVNQAPGSRPEEPGRDVALSSNGNAPDINISQKLNAGQSRQTADPPKEVSKGRPIRPASSPHGNTRLNRFEETPPPAAPHPGKAEPDSGNIVFLEKNGELSPETAMSPGVSNRSVLPQDNQSGQRMPDMNISVEIGKVVVENPSPPTPQTFRRPALRKPGMSLSDYLEKRSGGNR